MEQNKRRKATPLALGSILYQRYEIKKMLVRGGDSIIYLAHDYVLEKDVMIKELFPETYCYREPNESMIRCYSTDSELQYQHFKNHFYDQIKTLSLLQESPNFTKIYAKFSENNTCYYAMELLKGMDLEGRIRGQKRRLSEEFIIYVTLEVLNALEVMHGKGIIHCDICSSNIFLTNTGGIKVLGFGAEIFVSNNQASKDSPILALNPAYAPVEQYHISRKFSIGPWSDFYALGAVMYEATTGRRVIESIDRIMKDKLISPRKLNRKLSQKLDRVIMKALSLTPEERFQTAEEFRNCLLGR